MPPVLIVDPVDVQAVDAVLDVPLADDTFTLPEPGPEAGVDARIDVPDADAGPCAANPCAAQPNTRCEPYLTAYRCTCLDGFERPMGSSDCRNIDECARASLPDGGSSLCGPNMRCVDRVPGFSCDCDPGYVPAPAGTRGCVDENECLRTPAPCGAHARCDNMPLGSFTCTCDPGWTRSSPTTCVDVDECMLGLRTCLAHSHCENTLGDARCACDPGWQPGDGGQCADVDECMLGTLRCTGTATCMNRPGDAVCACPTGQSYDPLVGCVNTNECAADSDDCDPDAICTDTPTSFRCDCPPGASGDGRTCTFATSCRTLRAILPTATDGDYWIKPSPTVPALRVHCDLTSDGGAGYTFVRIVDAALAADQSAYVQACTRRGLEIVVPRSQRHLASIVQTYGEEPNVVNVMPINMGNTGLAGFEGRCGGAHCDYFLSETNSGDCATLQPDGTGSWTSRLVRQSSRGTCSSARWDDPPDGVPIPGWVICSTNDAAPVTPSSCLEALESGRVFQASSQGISGVYNLMTVTAPRASYRAYCDMTSYGGGWTLALKTGSVSNTFRYTSTAWTQADPIHPELPNLDRNEARLRSYDGMPFTQLLLAMDFGGSPSGPAWVTTPIAVSGASLLVAASGGVYAGTQLGKAAWRSMAPVVSLQTACLREGLNVAPVGTAGPYRVRIGVVADDNATCGSPNSAFGVGIEGTACSGVTAPVAGNVACSSADAGDANRYGYAAVFVREMPTAVSCQALLAQGHRRSGMYALDPDGPGGDLPFNAWCDMDTAGGGWTLAAIHGTDGRPPLFTGTSPRPGGSHYGVGGSVPGDLTRIRSSVSITAPNYSIDGRWIFDRSNHEALLYVGAPTRDYVTVELPNCNFFDASTFCQESTWQVTVRRSNTSTLTAMGYACTTAARRAPWTTDPFDEFGLQILDGLDTAADRHCYRGAAGTGTSGDGRIFATLNGSSGANWNAGVVGSWDAGGTTGIPGFVMIR